MDLMRVVDLKRELAKVASDEYALSLARFFKTGPGGYGEGDIFIGVRVPDNRKVCRAYRSLPLAEVQELLMSQIHEHRLAAVIIMNEQFRRADQAGKRAIYEHYMSALHEGYINNWDIVDTSAGHIVGEYLRDTDRAALIKLAHSKNLWERRVAIIATSAYIGTGDGSTTLEQAQLLLHDREDLIHKAVGWMLREVGKRVDEAALTGFLDEYASQMPRTMLRYACERLSPTQRSYYYQLT